VKLFKFGLHLWIALTSVISFLIGWIVLAHAPKPVQAQSYSSATSSSSVTVAPLPTLVPIQTLNLNGGSGFQNSQFNIQQAPPPQQFAPQQMMPVFQTSGS